MSTCSRWRSAIASAAKPPRPDRREEIVAAAAALLAERGLSATRTRDVAERAGVGAGLLNHYFPWAELRALALGRALAAGLDAVLPEAPDDPRAALLRLAETAFDDASDPVWRLWIEATEAAPGDPLVAARLAEAAGSLHARLARRLGAGVDAGLWACADPEGAALRLMALHDGLAGLILSGLPGLTREEAMGHLRRALALECPPGLG